MGGKAFSAQGKYTLRVPNRLTFSDFRGYEYWQVVAVSQTDDLLTGVLRDEAERRLECEGDEVLGWKPRRLEWVEA